MIAIVDYKAGNLTSVARALDKFSIPNTITSDAGAIFDAGRIIFPGVGAAGEAMANLRKFGLDGVIREAFRSGKPILGICIGTQVIMDASEENDTECLGLVPGKVSRFPGSLKDADGNALKIPHMGWNQVNWKRSHPVFENIPGGSEFYFVHSYFPVPSGEADVVGQTEYGVPFASAIAKGSLVAVQFHAEKSGTAGLKVLRNFAEWNGRS